MEDSVEAALVLGEGCEFEAPLLCAAPCSPSDADAEGMEGGEAGDAGGEVVEALDRPSPTTRNIGQGRRHTWSVRGGKNSKVKKGDWRAILSLNFMEGDREASHVGIHTIGLACKAAPATPQWPTQSRRQSLPTFLLPRQNAQRSSSSATSPSARQVSSPGPSTPAKSSHLPYRTQVYV